MNSFPLLIQLTCLRDDLRVIVSHIKKIIERKPYDLFYLNFMVIGSSFP